MMMIHGIPKPSEETCSHKIFPPYDLHYSGDLTDL
jgi:hypothetical protein